MVSKETINELSKILKADYGQDLTPTEVFEIAQGLVDFFEYLTKLDSTLNTENHDKTISNPTI